MYTLYLNVEHSSTTNYKHVNHEVYRSVERQTAQAVFFTPKENKVAYNK